MSTKGEPSDKLDQTTVTKPPLLPSGEYCVLFTDIEGSTRLWEHHPRAMKRALARHDDIMRHSIESRGGYVFKMIGDAFQAVFPQALRGLEAAVLAQRGLLQEGWDPEIGSIKVRMALHNCYVENHDGDFVGPSLNRLARLMAVAHGGQILLSLVSAELVRDNLPAGVSLRDMGERRLKDLIRPEHIYQVCVSDLPDNFPPLLTLDTLPNNLPYQASRFIGREEEIDRIKTLLGAKTGANSTHPILSLSGPGGTGKTRLALQVAAELVEDYPQGVWLVELATLSDPELLPQALAQAVGVIEQPGQPLLSTLLAYFKSRRALIILDNCEHMLDRVARLVTDLVRNCPSLQILATSRETLGLSGEVNFHLPPLQLPNPKKIIPIEKLQDFEAVQLFVDRAVAANPNWSITNGNARSVVKLCNRLDGLPLALELAAARLKMLSVEQILTKLDERFRLLTSSNRLVLPRQQTLRALIDWSHDLLSEPEQILWRRLSVFAGSWSLEGAEQLCSGAGLADYEVLDYLSQLINKSLVVVVNTTGSEARYRFLESICHYGQEKLRQAGEADELEERYVEYFARLGEEAAGQLSGSDQARGLKRLEEEHDNVRKTLELCLGKSTSQLEKGLKLATALWKFWEIRSYLTEGREWLNKLIEKASLTPLVNSTTYAWALNRLALLVWRQGNYMAARSRGEQALELMRILGDKVGIGATLNNLGNLLLEQGQVSEARKFFEESVVMVRQAGDKPRIITHLTNLGVLDASQGHFESARRLLSESLALSRELNNANYVAQILANLGTVTIMEKDFQAADRYLFESLKISRELDNTYFRAVILNNLGSSALGQARHEQALAYFGEGLALSRELDLKQEITQSLVGLAGLAVKQARFELGVELLALVNNLQTALGTTFVGHERTAYEEALEACRAKLETREFERFWHKGQLSELEEVISRATQILKTSPVDPTPQGTLRDGAVLDATTPVFQPGPPGPAQDRLVAGTVLSGTYRLEKRLGSGAMGEVWLAHHLLLNEPRAIKIMLQTLKAGPEVRQRFIEGEARQSLRLENHPHIVRVYDLGLHEGMPFIVMEYVAGGSHGATLKDLMKVKGKFSLWEVERILAQLAAALEVAHRQGLIHRDIKPGNVLLDGEGSALGLKLSDFGLIKDLNSDTELTSQDHLIGTPLYMAPDHAWGQPDTRSDIYSLGILIYQLLAGRTPFSGDVSSLLAQHIAAPPPPLHQVEASVPPEIGAAVMKALEKKPDNRYSSASQMAATYHRVLVEWEASQSENTSILPTSS